MKYLKYAPQLIKIVVFSEWKMENVCNAVPYLSHFYIVSLEKRHFNLT